VENQDTDSTSSLIVSTPTDEDRTRVRLTLSDLMTELDIGQEYLWHPDRLVQFEHWVGHIPFAFWLMKGLEPRVFVELGTHRGNSYCAMCQAVVALSLNSVGYAVDTWQGDLHMQSEVGLLHDLRTYHDPRYADFSTLMETTFEDAKSSFSDGKIDLLHIDGTHTYEAVRRDFEVWTSSLSNRGVVLFHDIEVMKEPFGVWRLWQELRTRFPSFHFSHSNGLGVLGVGPEMPKSLRKLFDMASDPQASSMVRDLFAARGDALVTQLRLAEWEAGLRQTDSEATRREAALLADADAKLRATETEAEQRIDAARAQHAAALTSALASAQREVARRAKAEAELRLALGRLEFIEQASKAAQRTTREATTRLNAIEQSTTWRALAPVRNLLSHVPPQIRHYGRSAIRLAWWGLTLQLARRLRERPARRFGADA